MPSRAHTVLAQVSLSCSVPLGRFPRVTHPSATPVLLRAFDLHVLSLPPAFVLSQDQTLKFEELCSSGVATGWSMRIDESQAYFDVSVEAWLHENAGLQRSVLSVFPRTARTPPPAFLFLSCYNVKEPEGSVQPSRLQSRQNITGPIHLAPDVHCRSLLEACLRVCVVGSAAPSVTRVLYAPCSASSVKRSIRRGIFYRSPPGDTEPVLRSRRYSDRIRRGAVDLPPRFSPNSERIVNSS